MNELIEQFLVEARELVEQATADLLALEERPGDRERLDSVFRAFHTLKGSAGIIEFPAMARALHAAEDALAGVRGGQAPVGPELAGDCLTSLDQVVQWLDHMEEHGALPPEAEAEASADALLRRFAREEAGQRDAAAPRDGQRDAAASGGTADHDGESWPEDLLARHPPAAGAATALRHVPETDAFFRGEDPLAMLAALPGLLAVEVAPVGEWPALDLMDPYLCRVRLSALLSTPPGEVSDLTQGWRGQVDVAAVTPGSASPRPSAEGLPVPGPDLPPVARALLDAQLLLLAEGGAEGAAGRIGSAGRVAANVLRRCGLAAEAARMGEEADASRAAVDPGRLSAAISACLRGEAAAAPAPAELRRAQPRANEPAREPEPADSPGTRPDPAPHAPEAAVRTLRVDAGRVDALVRLAGEFTVAANALGHAAALAREGADPTMAELLKDQHARLERLVGALQRSVLDLRVLPMRHVFQRFPRLVREIAGSLSKPVRLVVEGEETEADKAVVEGLPEPMLHLVRNAIDHGVEDAEGRAAAGKPAVATVRLRASRQAEHVVVEIEDDGRGIDPAAIRRAAAARNVASAADLDAMSDGEALELIFAPGFSTAATTTALSGRGVGMDAVRAAVERLGGRVTVDSRPGEGTTVRLRLPFTVMMTRVMTVEAGGQVFGIPLDAVVETVRVPRAGISPVGAAHAFVLRDRTVPLIDLACALGEAGGRAGDPGAGDANVVVATVGGAPTGLEVERLGERMDVMLRPVEGLLAGIRGIAGTTLLGDGRVLIVVDIQDLLA